MQATSIAAEEIEIQLVHDAAGLPSSFAIGISKEHSVALSKLPDESDSWGRLLSVYVISKNASKDLPMMLGSYRLDGQTLRFTPQFSLRSGMKYRVIFRPEEVGRLGLLDKPTTPPISERNSITREFQMPDAPATPATKVTAIYPRAELLPENLLRFYVHFSAPMSRGEAYKNIRLLDDKQRVVPFAFLELGEELWDKSGRRLTLLIDPGRIKRGLKPREDMGTVLTEGKEYKLVVQQPWRDANGKPLRQSLEKPFAVGPPIEKALDPAQWKMGPLLAGTVDPLVIEFPSPLDRALLERTITVKQPGDVAVPGRIQIGDSELSWTLYPDQPWVAGKHELVVDGTLEDPAGNRIGMAFDVDLLRPVEKRVVEEFVRIPFVVGK